MTTTKGSASKIQNIKRHITAGNKSLATMINYISSAMQHKMYMLEISCVIWSQPKGSWVKLIYLQT